MAVVVWTEQASNDLDDILAYVELHNPIAAVDLVETIIGSGNALKSFPARNPIRHEGGIRERPVLGTRYILLYRIERDGRVLILSVRHSARELRES